MSSLIGHAVAGAAVYFASGASFARLQRGPGASPAVPPARWDLPLFVLLATLPDIDYFALWLFKLHGATRITHSLAFCLSAALLAWAVSAKARRTISAPVGYSMLALAACSHLVLDLLVGAHAVPVFWPFSAHAIMSPIGLLPSAGHLRLDNYYLWRNLLIECGVLWPVLALGVALCRGVTWRSLGSKALLLGPLWGACLLWSIGLQR